MYETHFFVRAINNTNISTLIATVSVYAIYHPIYTDKSIIRAIILELLL